MGLDMQNPAAANGRVCEGNSHLAGRDTPQPTIASDHAQYQLIAKIRKSAREEFRVARRCFKNFRGVEIRVFKLNGEGSFVETNRAVALRLTALPDIINALKRAVPEEVEGLS